VHAGDVDGMMTTRGTRGGGDDDGNDGDRRDSNVSGKKNEGKETVGVETTTYGACGVEVRRGEYRVDGNDDGDDDDDGNEGWRRADAYEDEDDGVEKRQVKLALVAEYEMDALSGTRVGGVRAYACVRRRGGRREGDSGEVEAGSTANTTMEFIEAGSIGRGTTRMETIGAIFECRWSARAGDGARCAFAGADGYVTLASLREEFVPRKKDVDSRESGISKKTQTPSVTFQELSRAYCGGEGLGMATCLDWRSDGALVVSAADGSFRVAKEDVSAIEIVTTIERAHDLEMWAVAFDPWREGVVYTGADDCAFKAWDVRADGASGAQMVNRKTHGAGVTCVAPAPRNEHVVATGSYDDHVRLWDVRKITAPLSELNVGGGAWRCRWHPTRDALACAAMGGGAVLIDVESASGTLSKAYVYDAHESIVYGADWVSFESDGDDAVVSCSFYDKSVRCWNV